MFTFTILTLLASGLALTLALSLLLMVIWQNPRGALNRLFAFFLFAVAMWVGGSLRAGATAAMGIDPELTLSGLRLLEFGFSASNIALYLLTLELAGYGLRPFKLLIYVGLGIFLLFQIAGLVTKVTPFRLLPDGRLQYELTLVGSLFYGALSMASMFFAWHYRRRINQRVLTGGVMLFAAAQIMTLVSADLRNLGAPILLAAGVSTVMGYAVVRRQVMRPLIARTEQLEAVREVGLSITRRLELVPLLESTAAYAAQLLSADGTAIFLLRGETLTIAATHNLPDTYRDLSLKLGEGLAGKVALDRRSYSVDDYARDWQGDSDVPWARESFGSVIGVPLLAFGQQVYGVLIVVEGRQGRIFGPEDIELLELLAPQATAAIANSRLYEQQRTLARELFRARAQMESLLVSTESPVLAADRELRILFANPAARTLLNLPDEAAITGKQLDEHAPRSFFPPELRAFVRDLRQKRVHLYEINVEDRTYQCNIAPLGVLEGGLVSKSEGWVVILNDVTNLKELDRLKSQMIRMTSHDLKNPLFAAMSYLELLQEDIDDLEPILGERAGFPTHAELAESTGVIWTQLERMNRIIAGILNLERVQSGTPAYEICNLLSLLRGAVKELESQADAKQIRIETDLPEKLPGVLGDPRQLEQSFINILDNAIKFTGNGGRVRIEAAAERERVLLTFEDNGIGIPKEAHAQIFGRFFRAQQKGAEHISGSGLGLSLVKAVVDGHQGRIWFESASGEGTTFYISLPLAKLEL
jgi:signal transduction histidine kinase